MADPKPNTRKYDSRVPTPEELREYKAGEKERAAKIKMYQDEYDEYKKPKAKTRTPIPPGIALDIENMRKDKRVDEEHEAGDKARKESMGKIGFKSGGSVGSASKRADGCAVRGKTKGRMI